MWNGQSIYLRNQQKYTILNQSVATEMTKDFLFSFFWEGSKHYLFLLLLGSRENAKRITVMVLTDRKEVFAPKNK